MNHLKEYRQATEITSFFMFCVFLFHPILAPFMKLHGLSDFQVGLMFALFPLTVVFTSTIFGSLSDSIGRKKIIVFGVILQVLAVALYIVGSGWIFAAARFLEALAFVSVTLVGLAKVQDSIDSKSRGKYSGWALTIMQIGKMVSPVIGGLLADYWFVKAPFIFSMLSLLIMLWLISLREPLKINHHFTRSDFSFLSRLRRFFSDRRLAGVGILGMVMHASIALTLVFMPLYIIGEFNLAYRYVGYAFFALQFFLLFQFYVGTLCDRFSRRHLLLFGVLLYGLSLGFLSLAQSYSAFMIILLVAGIGSAFWNVACWSFLSDIGERAKKEGFVIGTYMSVAKMGDFISFVFSGLIVGWLGFKGFAVIISALIILGGIAASFLLLDKRGQHS